MLRNTFLLLNLNLLTFISNFKFYFNKTWFHDCSTILSNISNHSYFTITTENLDPLTLCFTFILNVGPDSLKIGFEDS